MSTISVTATLLLTKPLDESQVRGEAIDVDVAIRVKRSRDHGSDQVAILGNGIAGDRIDDLLGIRPGDAAILQRVVVVADALQVSLHEATPDLRALGDE